jgi:hypothetical protein
VERECKMFVWRDGPSIELHEVRNGTVDYWLARLHPGEPVLVFDDDTADLVAKAVLTDDGRIQFDRVFDATFVVMTRVRAVPSCALDEIDKRGTHTNEQTGDAIGRHRTLVARQVKAALEKAIKAAAKMGMSRGDLLRGLREVGST